MITNTGAQIPYTYSGRENMSRYTRYGAASQTGTGAGLAIEDVATFSDSVRQMGSSAATAKMFGTGVNAGESTAGKFAGASGHELIS